MDAPRLVVMSGYPSSGKSTIIGYMQTELGFSKVSSDDRRAELYGKTYPELMRDERGELKENIMWNDLNHSRMSLISKGFDTVVDTTAPTNQMRSAWLDTRYADGILPAEKYLIVLRVEREELLRRDHPESVTIWDAHWEDPERDPVGYDVLYYMNNTPQEREFIYEDLRKRFERRNKLWIPSTA